MPNIDGGHNQDFRTIPSLWGKIDGVIALDVGCGQGVYTGEMVRRGAALVVGMDLNMENLRKAEAVSTGHKGAYWVCGDAVNLPFKNGVFNVVGCVEVLSHLPRIAQRDACCEMARVSSVGATLWVTLHNSIRMAFARRLRLKRPLEEYPTSNLDVWPTPPHSALEMLGQCGIFCSQRVYYLNYHSRFTLNFYRRHPLASKFVIAIEEVLAKLPILKRLGITFLLSGRRLADDE
jgi:SAM-dependent methyltransferase